MLFNRKKTAMQELIELIRWKLATNNGDGVKIVAISADQIEGLKRAFDGESRLVIETDAASFDLWFEEYDSALPFDDPVVYIDETQDREPGWFKRLMEANSK